jgi:hypothetical protein
LSLKSAEYRLSSHKSKVKRLTDSHTAKSYKSFLSSTSRRPLTPPIHIPKMSKQSLKRWLDARDAYLGHGYPYIQERFERHRRRRRTKSSKEDNKMIDYDEAVSILSLDTDQFSVPELISNEKQRRLSRKDSHIRRISHSETNLRCSGRSLFERIKSFVQSPIRSISHLSIRKSQQSKKTQIIHDNFDDKCVGTEISERIIFRKNVERNDQAIQVNLARPQIELHHEFDTSMVDGEKKQRIRSVRRYIEYSDKATETEFIVNFANVEKERREEKKLNDDEDDKATRRDIEGEQKDPYTKQSNVEQQHQLPSMPDTGQHKTRKNESIQSSKHTHTGNRIVPLTDLFQTTTNNENKNNDQQNGSRSTILSPTESNISTHEQLQR